MVVLFQLTHSISRPTFAVVEVLAESYTDCSTWPIQSQFAQVFYLTTPMRFTLIDRIIELEPGVRITAVKSLTMGEEYLLDHFPRFPVMPGVLMLEAMTQAGAWLVRATEDFAHSMVVLKQASNVKYAQFVEPGQTLTVTAEIISQTDCETKLKTFGHINDEKTVGARLVLTRFNLADSNSERAVTDRTLTREMRDLFALLYHGPLHASNAVQPAGVLPERPNGYPHSS